MTAQWRKSGEKRCTKCGEVRAIERFYFSREGYPSAVCKLCTNKGKIAPRLAWVNGEKECPKCRVVKPLTEYTIVKGRAHPAGRCKACRSNDASARWKLRNPEKVMESERNARLRLKYGITSIEYERMLQEQNGKCAICKSSEPTSKVYKSGKSKHFAVDHCHTTGRVRGLLCTKCNRALGLLNDDIQRIAQMVSYLSNCK